MQTYESFSFYFIICKNDHFLHNCNITSWLMSQTWYHKHLQKAY